jgi:exopolysaccharide biosynthesis polyprenyl glycosylphosphotransferase
LKRLVLALKDSTRETDSGGWYQAERTIGVIFTEVGDADESVMATILAKVANGLRNQLTAEQMARLEISLHRYPDADRPPQRLDRLALYPDLLSHNTQRKVERFLKRTLDCLASALFLVLLFPVFLAVALAIKLTSKGPVLFKQKRIGQYGTPFTFLKFRSMYDNSDPRIHREYVSQLIAGSKTANGQGDNESGVYKITADPRVTPVGRFLRKSSLDELPQLWNVLKGEMSLVGPRPPLPYEFERYDIWHRRRVVEAKPGITGLWQVAGRSRTSFDDMVRLDLKYVIHWSIWLDLKILFQTPGAVLSGDGAY